MATIGFTTYVQPTPDTPPTIAEILAALTVQQRLDILDGFAKKVPPLRFKYVYGGNVPRSAVRKLYVAIDEVEEIARLLMREEIVTTEATYDAEGVELTPAVYNTAPTDRNDLVSDLEPGFVDVFNTIQIGAVVDEIIYYSELNAAGTAIGTWAIYAAEVVK